MASVRHSASIAPLIAATVAMPGIGLRLAMPEKSDDPPGRICAAAAPRGTAPELSVERRGAAPGRGPRRPMARHPRW
jgi:hypothetical protein